jgi:hypothetical protein
MPTGSPNAGYKTFNTGDVLTAAQVQYNLQNQTIMYFADATARDAALTAGVVQEGMFAYLADTDSVTFYNGTLWVTLSTGGDLTAINAGPGITVTNGSGPIPTVSLSTNPTLTSPKETATISATAATGTVNLDVSTSTVLIYTTNASGNWTLNVRGNNTTTLNSIMSTGEQITVVFESAQGSPAYYPTAFTIDGSAPTYIKWLGGTAPSSGNINSNDVYVYTIRKTGAGAFTVLASQNKFA